MTVKQFFKGKAFKSIVVLLCVLLVSGVLLSIAWGFLEVTDEERFARKIGAVYGGETVTSVEQDLTGKNTSVSDANVEKMWLIKEKNDYLVQVSARGNNGDITCWVAVNMSEDLKSVKGIGKVLVYSVDDAAEYIMNIGADVYKKFETDYVDGKTFNYADKSDDEFISTGATFSLGAVCNNVNGAIEFAKSFNSGGATADPFEGLTVPSTVSKNTKRTYWSVENGVITYRVRVNKGSEYDGPSSSDFDITVAKVDGVVKITACTTNVEEMTSEGWRDKISAAAKNLTGATLAEIESYLADTTGEYLQTGATGTNDVCYKAALFALKNYDAIIAKEAAE